MYFNDINVALFYLLSWNSETPDTAIFLVIRINLNSIKQFFKQALVELFFFFFGLF